MDPLAFARGLPLEQSDENTQRGVQAGAGVGDREPGTHRPLAGQPRHRHQPAHALYDLVEARPPGVGPLLAEAGNARQDDAGIDCAQ
ncbi:hypothetical protein D3C72_2106630 [compost metagenome]